EPAEKFAEQLIDRLPKQLDKIFYSDNGSTAVEAALKIAFQYWRNQGIELRSRFIAFDGGYHGDTLGAMSVGRGAGFWKSFAGIMCDVDLVPFPETFEGDEQVGRKEAESIKAIRNLLESDPHRYAAVCIEPLVQGVGGMRMCRPEFLHD